MHRSKINDRFEFPTKLDMNPYTIDHLSSRESGSDIASEPDEFELVGVLVHTGTAESGHYYSYIRDRLTPAEYPSWYEFNDSEVSTFDPSTIPDNCFGGNDNVSATGYALPKSFSAYMLFYQRSSSLDAAPNQVQASPITTRLRKEILRENEELIRRHSMFSPDYVLFVTELISTYLRKGFSSEEEDLEVLHLGLKTFDQICARVKDFPETDKLLNVLEELTTRTEESAKAFLDWASEPHTINSLILENPFQAIRGQFTGFITNTLDYLKARNPYLYGCPLNEDDFDEVPARESTALYTVCRGFADSWYGLQNSLKPWNDFFFLLATIADQGDCEKEYMLKVGILEKLLELIIIDYIPVHRRADRRIEGFVKIMGKPRVPLTRCGQLLVSLMQRVSPFILPARGFEERDDNIVEGEPLPMTVSEWNYLRFIPKRTCSMGVFTKLLENPTSLTATERLTQDLVSAPWAPAEHEFLEAIKLTLITGISVEPAVHAAPFLACLNAFIAGTKSQEYVGDIVSRVSEEVGTIGTTGGSEHLRFFQRVWHQDGPLDYHLDVVKTIRDWAPALLVFYESKVRDSTEAFLDKIIFHNTPLDASECLEAITSLADGLFNFIFEKFPSNRQSADDSTFSNSLSVLNKCKEYLEGDEEHFLARYEGEFGSSSFGVKAVVDCVVLELRVFIERMVLEEEEDADAASGMSYSSSSTTVAWERNSREANPGP